MDYANTLVMAAALPGGKLPQQFKEIMLQAIARHMDIVSCGHEFISEDPDLVSSAKKVGVLLRDVRKNAEHDVARDGPQELVDAILNFKKESFQKSN